MSEAEKTGETDLDIDELIELVGSVSNLGKHGPTLGRITDITKAPDFINVQPLLAKMIQGRPRLDPELQDVPVAWPGTAAGRLTFPLVVGDKVELIPLAGDLTPWITSEAEVPSPNARSQSLSDVVALVESPASKVNPTPAEAYSAAAVVLYAASMLLLGDNTATEFVALAGLVSGNETAVQAWLDAHTHDASTIIAPAGGGACTGISGPPVTAPATPDPSPTPGNIAATKVKAI